MDMRIDADRVRLERTNRAWSQEHLANVTGLGLRTIQRIETSGTAPNESISAMASAFEVPVSDLLKRDSAIPPDNWLTFVAARRLWVLLALTALVQVLSPPVLSVPMVGLWVWAAFELVLYLTSRRSPNAGAVP